MRNTLVLSTSWILLLVTSLQAYIILDAKTEVSPGCEGGVLSRRCTSFINTGNDEPNSSDENLDTPDKKEDL